MGSDFHTDIVRAMDLLANDDEAPVSSFYARGDLPLPGLRVQAVGMDALSTPVTNEQLAQLRALAKQAGYGLRDKTCVDKQVRDTLEIAAKDLSLTWDDVQFAQLQTQVLAGLGLPMETPLTLELHNLLLYEAGQFFKPHQDTEKMEGMVATLVLVLPSAHLGGDLILTHQNKTHTFKSENLKAARLKWLVFYADCQHEVKVVTEGHRLVLTFNVALQIANHAQSANEAAPNEALLTSLREYLLETPEQSAAATLQEQREVRRLAYYLDHQYTEHSLRWGLLKGADRHTALTLKQTAQALGLKVHLALADIHEMWTAQEDDYDTRYDYRRSKKDDVNEPERGELIDSSASLDFWVNANSEVVPYEPLHLKAHDICWRRETDDEDLVDSEYEGYMGNYGNTMDYWYRRAAVVLWSEDAQIGTDFTLNFDAALQALAQQSDAQKLRRTVGIALPWLAGQAEIKYFSAYAALSVRVEDAAQATQLMKGFLLRDFTDSVALHLAALGKAYGQPWADKLLAQWCAHMQGQVKSKGADYDYPSRDWTLNKTVRPSYPTDLMTLVQALQRQRVATSWINTLFHACCECYVTDSLRYAQTSERTLNAVRPALFTQMLALWQVCQMLAHKDMLTFLVQHALALSRIYPLIDIAPLLNQMDAPLDPALANLADNVVTALDHALAKGLPDIENKTIAVQGKQCQCGICAPVFVFLASEKQTELILPLAEAKREHVQTSFTQLDLPISFDILKIGSPYRLQIRKATNLYVTAKKRFEWLQNQRAALTNVTRSQY